jgi:hypothetical protein
MPPIVAAEVRLRWADIYLLTNSELMLLSGWYYQSAQKVLHSLNMHAV